MNDLAQAAYFTFGLVTLAFGVKNVATGGPTLIGGSGKWKAGIKKLYRPIGVFQVLLGVASVWYAFAAS